MAYQKKWVVSCLPDNAANTDVVTVKVDPPNSNTHLVIHFDINETILVGDEAGGDSRDDCLNKMLAKSAFVKIPTTGTGLTSVSADISAVVPTHWWDGTPIQDEYDEASIVPPPLYTGWEWPVGCCPYYRTAYKKLSTTFVSHHGSIYKAVYNEIRDKLHPSRFGDQHCILSHMLPAFFETLVELSNDDNITIVMRTFGTDLTDIAAAISQFARGEHPDYPNFRNENLVLDSDSLVKGRWVQHEHGNNKNCVYQLWNADDLVVASGDAAVVEYLHSRRICGIQDDYEHWSANECEPWAGKPVWILVDPKFHHVLLDDNM
jgi:hypothetical protein